MQILSHIVPADVWNKIISHSSPQALGRLSITCKFLRQRVNAVKNEIWQAFYRNENLGVCPTRIKNWKQAYINQRLLKRNLQANNIVQRTFSIANFDFSELITCRLNAYAVKDRSVYRLKEDHNHELLFKLSEDISGIGLMPLDQDHFLVKIQKTIGPFQLKVYRHNSLLFEPDTLCSKFIVDDQLVYCRDNGAVKSFSFAENLLKPILLSCPVNYFVGLKNSTLVVCSIENDIIIKNLDTNEEKKISLPGLGMIISFNYPAITITQQNWREFAKFSCLTGKQIFFPSGSCLDETSCYRKMMHSQEFLKCELSTGNLIKSVQLNYPWGGNYLRDYLIILTERPDGLMSHVYNKDTMEEVYSRKMPSRFEFMHGLFFLHTSEGFLGIDLQKRVVLGKFKTPSDVYADLNEGYVRDRIGNTLTITSLMEPLPLRSKM